MADKKRTDDLNWDDLRFFVALARQGSLSAAARQLRVNHATVARRLASVEAHLGRILFERRPDGYVLTSAGRQVLRASEQMELAAAALQVEATDAAGPRGTVRLTTTRSFADGFLVGRLGGLARQYPGIDLQLIADSRNLSLDRREVDLALRLGRPQSGGFLARQVAAIDYGFYATAAVSADREARLIAFDEGGADLPEAQLLQRAARDRAVVFRSNSQIAQAAAAAAGIGIALLPSFLARPMPALQPIDLGIGPLQRDVWLLIRKDQRQLPRIKAVADYLITDLHAARPVLRLD
jgi:DNA-binding transcriptional LysR family regulator